MTALDLGLVTVVGGQVRPVASAEVEALERDLGTPMPTGYRDYVTRLGAGTLETFVRVLTPARIASGLLEHRGLVAGFWHWGSGSGDLDQDALASSIPVADTLDGDVVTFVPGAPDRLIVLPRNSDGLVVREEGLLDTIEWILSSGVLVAARKLRQFEPFAEPDTAETSDPFADAGPVPAGSPTDVVHAYLSDLLDVERWAYHAVGDDRGDEADRDEVMARSDAVRRRYLTAALAHASRGASVTISKPAEHDRFEITDERPGRGGKVLVETREGGDMIFVRRYTLAPDGDGYRIGQVKELATELPPPPPSGIGGRFRSLFGKDRDRD
jgi:hypothetical protein